MIKRLITTIIITTFALTAANSLAEPAQKTTSPTAQQATAPATVTPPAYIIPPPPKDNARGYVVMDANSGEIIASKNMNERMAPASLTKLMTVYLTFNALAHNQFTLDSKARVSEEAWRTGGSRMFLKLGSHVPVKDLIDGIIVASGNDACVAISQYVAGSQGAFVDMMNKAAHDLGMKNSHFTDATGLPHPDHYSTPHDIALLARAIITQYPQYYHFFKDKWVTWNGIRQPNRNRLLWRDPTVDGMKTGHTKEAGYCLVASAKRDGMRLITVVMGTPSDSARNNDSQALLTWGFRFYNTHKLYAADQVVKTARVWMAEKKEVNLGVNNDIYITIPRGQYDKLKATVVVKKPLEAPIVKGQQYGEIDVTLAGKNEAKVPLIALADDPRGGFFTRMKDHVELFFANLFGKV